MWFSFIVLLICVGCSGLIAGVEVAFVSMGKSQLKHMAKEGNLQARRLLLLRENPVRALSLMQIGMTFFSAVAAAIGGEEVGKWLAPLFQVMLHLSPNVSEVVAIIFFMIPFTYITVVLGELVPKTVSFRNPQKVIFFAVPWLVFVDRVLYPLVTFFEKSTKFFVSILMPTHFKKTADESGTLATGELNLDGLTSQHKQYLTNLVALEQKRLIDIMLPWSQVVALDCNLSIGEVENVVVTSAHTRLPVLENTQVIGIIHAKEFMAYVKSLPASPENQQSTSWRQIIRPMLKFTDFTSLLFALRQMQEKHSHMGLVVKNQVILGMVTIEDILEEVVGEIYDEDDDGVIRRLLSLRAKHKYLASGRF